MLDVSNDLGLSFAEVLVVDVELVSVASLLERRKIATEPALLDIHHEA